MFGDLKSLVEAGSAAYDSLMQQFVLTICLIANLLACPLRCAAGHASMNCEDAPQKKQTCQCCAKKSVCSPEETPDSQQPGEQPEDDSSCCPGCICEGATLTKAVESSFHWLGDFVNYCVAAGCSSRHCSTISGGFGAGFACPQPADSSTALALRQSWRI